MATKKYTCIIVDDEPLARQLLETHITDIAVLELIATFSSAIEANQFLNSNSVDFIFLDIQMPKLTGIDFLKALQSPPKVIFTTAYSEFALEGYELNVIDYLLKPITFERFCKATNKVIEILNLENEVKLIENVELKENSILIKSSHQLIKIDLSTILYIEGLHKYIKIVTTDKKHTTLYSMTAVEADLPPDFFYRCHRSFIVNLRKVELIDGNLAVIGANKIPISINNKSELIQKLGKKIG